MSSKATPTPPVGVRLPAELLAYVKQQASANFRSVSAEIVMRVELSRQADLAQQAQGAQA